MDFHCPSAKWDSHINISFLRPLRYIFCYGIGGNFRVFMHALPRTLFFVDYGHWPAGTPSWVRPGPVVARFIYIPPSGGILGGLCLTGHDYSASVTS